MLHQIGNGALGPVFRAYDSDRDRLVAVKVFRVDLPPERVHQLVGEFEKLIGAELQHPVIAAPRATGIDSNNNAFLAQSFAAADSLDIVMREQGPAPIARVLRVASQLAEALDYAAERQILHGALHPRDILLSEDDIRIVGLGVSRALERVGVASPVRRPYSAPERINDEGWDQRADVFSLAAIVYELLCGKRVTGTGSEAAESLGDVAGCDLAALSRVFSLALAADPQYRFATATAFVDALKDTVSADPSADLAVSTQKSKVKRPRTKLRVVTPTLIDADAQAQADAQPLRDVEEIIPSEVEGFVSSEGLVPIDVDGFVASEVEALAPSEVEGLEIDPMRQEPASSEIAALPLLEFAPETPDDSVPPAPEHAFDEFESSTPARRKVPAPTPVAIETVVSAPDLFLAEESSDSMVWPAEPEPAAIVADVIDEAPIEQPDLIAFAETPDPVSRIDERYVDVARMVEEPVAVAPASIEPTAPAEPRLPAFLNPDFSPPLPAEPARLHAPVWPIGVAAVIGIAIGFGVGYTVAIRDRGVPVPVAASSPAPPIVVAQPATTAPPAAPVVVEPLLAPPTPKAAPSNTEPPVPAVFDGRVLVRSTPSGARVFVDGKDRGQTPVTVGALGRGEHRLRIVRDGYTVAERRVVLSPSRPSQSLAVPLAREPGAKDAVVPKPAAPAAPAAKATPEATATPTPAAATSAQPGGLVIESRPPGATVVVDGRVAGTTPLNLGDVRAGNHAVRIERDGYRTWTSTVTVTGGEQSRVTASLER